MGLGDMFKKAFENENMAPPAPAGLNRVPDTVKVRFVGGNIVDAYPGQRISIVANKARCKIKYDCREGDCGTCTVKINGKKVKACQASLPASSSLHHYVIEYVGKGRI
jgi:ferredoxin